MAYLSFARFLQRVWSVVLTQIGAVFLSRMPWLVVVSAGLALPAAAHDQGDAWAAMRQGNAVVLIRHAYAPGVGDPPGFLLGDCTTQRVLNEEGRQQARRIGHAFKERGVQVGRVVSSQWCRALETAHLAFPGKVLEEPVFNSFFHERVGQEEQTSKARALIRQWRGPGVLVIVTHQVNITALTGVVPASGQGLVVRIDEGQDDVRQLGSIQW